MIVSRNPRVTEGEFFDAGYDVVVQHGDTGQVRHLGGTAASIWALIDGSTTVEQIIEELSEIYGVDPTIIDQDVRETIDEFAALSLLDGQISAPEEPAKAEELSAMPRPPDP